MAVPRKSLVPFSKRRFWRAKRSDGEAAVALVRGIRDSNSTEVAYVEKWTRIIHSQLRENEDARSFGGLWFDAREMAKAQYDRLHGKK